MNYRMASAEIGAGIFEASLEPNVAANISEIRLWSERVHATMTHCHEAVTFHRWHWYTDPSHLQREEWTQVVAMNNCRSRWRATDGDASRGWCGKPTDKSD